MPIRAENNKIMETKKQLLNEREPEACLYGPPPVRNLKSERDTDPEMKSQQETDSQPETDQQPLLQRHGFVTFWLWLMMVLNAVFAIGGLAYVIGDITHASSSRNYLSNYAFAEGIVQTVLCIINIYGAYLLLKWKKKGFTIFEITIGILLIMQCFYAGLMHEWGFIVTPVIGSLIAIGILYGILQIRKNGVSCWSQLK